MKVDAPVRDPAHPPVISLTVVMFTAGDPCQESTFILHLNRLKLLVNITIGKRAQAVPQLKDDLIRQGFPGHDLNMTFVTNPPYTPHFQPALVQLSYCRGHDAVKEMPIGIVL